MSVNPPSALVLSVAFALGACSSPDTFGEARADAGAGGNATATTTAYDRDMIERVAVTALAERFSDACNVGDGEAFASLWHPARADWRIGPPMGREFHGADSLAGALDEMLGLWDFFVQTPNATVVEFSDDYQRATSRTHVVERGRLRDGSGNYNLSYYLDTLSKVGGQWRYESRTYYTTYQEDHDYFGKVYQDPIH